MRNRIKKKIHPIVVGKRLITMSYLAGIHVVSWQLSSTRRTILIFFQINFQNNKKKFFYSVFLFNKESERHKCRVSPPLTLFWFLLLLLLCVCFFLSTNYTYCHSRLDFDSAMFQIGRASERGRTDRNKKERTTIIWTHACEKNIVVSRQELRGRRKETPLEQVYLSLDSKNSQYLLITEITSIFCREMRK